MKAFHGTKQHVESLMLDLGWCKPDAVQDTLEKPSDIPTDSQPVAELFLWAILRGRTEMAMIFWRRQVVSTHATDLCIPCGAVHVFIAHIDVLFSFRVLTIMLIAKELRHPCIMHFFFWSGCILSILIGKIVKTMSQTRFLQDGLFKRREQHKSRAFCQRLGTQSGCCHRQQCK